MEHLKLRTGAASIWSGLVAAVVYLVADWREGDAPLRAIEQQPWNAGQVVDHGALIGTHKLAMAEEEGLDLKQFGQHFLNRLFKQGKIRRTQCCSMSLSTHLET